MGVKFSGGIKVPSGGFISKTIISIDPFALAFGGSGADQVFTDPTLALDASGNIYAAGVTDSFGAGGSDALLSKFDQTGNHTFSRVLGGSGSESFRGLALDSSGNIYAAGAVSSFGAGNNDALLSKFDSSGTHLFSRALGGLSSDRFFSMTLDSSNNVYAVGEVNSFGAGGRDALLSKFDSSGTHLFSRALGGVGTDDARGVTTDSSGNVYVVGFTTSFGAGGQDALLSKFDSSGTHLFSRVLGGSSTDRFFSVILDSSNNIYCAGETASFGTGTTSGLLSKFDSSGTHLFSRALGGPSAEVFSSITLDTSNNLYIAGRTFSFGAGDNDGLLSKFDSSGTHLFSRTFGGALSDRFFTVVLDSSDNIYVAGDTSTFGTGTDAILARFNSSGEIPSCSNVQTISPTVTTISPTVSSISPTVTNISPTVSTISPTVSSASPTITSIC